MPLHTGLHGAQRATSRFVYISRIPNEARHDLPRGLRVLLVASAQGNGTAKKGACSWLFSRGDEPNRHHPLPADTVWNWLPIRKSTWPASCSVVGTQQMRWLHADQSMQRTGNARCEKQTMMCLQQSTLLYSKKLLPHGQNKTALLEQLQYIVDQTERPGKSNSHV